MGRTPDIAGYFEKLTQRGRGGSRLDGQPDRRRVRDRVRDVVTKGRDAASRTAERARPRRGPAQEPAHEPPRRPRSSGNLVTIEYTPSLDGDPDPGEVVWVWVPYEEDPTQGKDRPVVVVGRRGDTLVGIPLTSKPHDDEVQVEVGTGAWDSKRRTSYARIWRMVEVDPAEIRREGAILDRDRFDRVIAALDDHYDIKRVETSTSSRRRRTSVEDEDF